MSKKKETTAITEHISEFHAYKFALDASAIVTITDTKGTLTYINETFCNISKYTKEELIGQNQRIVSSGYHSIEFWKNMWATIGKGQVWKSDIRNRTKTGEIYWVATTIVPFMNEKGKPYQYLSIRQDITKQKQLEQGMINSILFSQEKDRENFSEGLHEGLAQTLTGLKFLMGSIERKTKEYNNESLNKDIQSIKNYLQESIENTQDLALSLMPRTLMQYGFIASLEDVALKASNANQAPIKLAFDTDEITLEEKVNITLYRTITELITWANTFSDLQQISVHVITQKIIDIQIDLKGIFCKNQWMQTASTSGLQQLKLLEKRLELLGGKLIVSEDTNNHTTTFSIKLEDISQ